LFLVVKKHSEEDSSLFIESKNKKSDSANEDVKVESKETKTDDKANKEGEV
jgi:hypothetical protein